MKDGDSNRPKHPESAAEEAPRALAPMDFSTFVLSLASTAQIHLGVLAGPDSETPNVDLTSAKQLIDILGILKEKTEGNLEDSESKLLCSLLYDLRVQYVDAQKG